MVTRTNAYSLLCMIIRAIAVWSLCKAAITIPGAAVMFRNSPELGPARGWYLGGAALTLLVIAALWLFADKLAKLALVRPQEMVFESSMDPTTWLGLLLSAIGAWFCFSGLVSALYMGIRWAAVLRLPAAYDAGMGPETVADIASTALEVVLGATLVLRGQGLSRLIYRLRYGVEAPAAISAP